jgi:hypothetical protein
MGKGFPLDTRAYLGYGHGRWIADEDPKTASCEKEGVAAVSAPDLEDRIIAG